jgi:hypothetical protein
MDKKDEGVAGGVSGGAKLIAVPIEFARAIRQIETTKLRTDDAIAPKRFLASSGVSIDIISPNE